MCALRFDKWRQKKEGNRSLKLAAAHHMTLGSGMRFVFSIADPIRQGRGTCGDVREETKKGKPMHIRL